MDALRTEGDDDEQSIILDTITIGSVSNAGLKYPTAIVTVQAGSDEHTCKFKIDTGAQANVLSVKELKKFITDPIRLKKTNTRLAAYKGSHIPCIGTIKLSCATRNKQLKADFFVIEKEETCILGYQTCTDLELVFIPQELEVNGVSLADLPKYLREYEEVLMVSAR